MLEALYNAIRKDAKPVVIEVNGKKYSTWKYLGRMPIGEAYQHKATSLTVISSIDTIENENGTSKVLHVSVSRKSRLPSWDDLKRAKNTFMGLDVDAYHVIPKADDHVNLHNYCMHLWAEWRR